MRKNNIPKKYLIYFALLTLVISFSGCSKTSNVKSLDTQYISPSYVVDMNNPKEVVGSSSNVFIGYIEEMTDTYYISNLPYTRYNVKVINNIKGELPIDSTVRVNKEGGISENSSYYILLENDFLPDEGEYYIFNVRERSEDGSYTASGINSVVLINDIDMQSVTGDITPDNSNASNIKQESDEDIVVNELENSEIYQKYVDAYKNQIVFDPNK